MPSSTINCSGRLWVWSKNAWWRCGNGVSDQAKLNSPNPTPSHGFCAIRASVSRQIAKRPPDGSRSPTRAAAPR